MPRDVDPEQRLAEIAAATVRVAESGGTHAVTIRSVAKELGGSTTLVTNYVPSRAALILNALDHALVRWNGALDAELDSEAHADRLQAVLAWALATEDDDPVLRSLIIEIVANAAVEPDLRAALQRESRAFRNVIRDAADASGYADPDALADLLYVIVRGAAFASLEDPEGWTDARVRAVVERAVASAPRRDG